jgi:hypothetical protein
MIVGQHNANHIDLLRFGLRQPGRQFNDDVHVPRPRVASMGKVPCDNNACYAGQQPVGLFSCSMRLASKPPTLTLNLDAHLIFDFQSHAGLLNLRITGHGQRFLNDAIGGCFTSREAPIGSPHRKR